MWRTPEELVSIGFSRSRVVMMNEFHSGLQRCSWTREVGRRILPVAHQAGVRYLAMEALNPPFAEKGNQTRQVPEAQNGYLAQPDMRALIQTALDLGMTLLPYEADMNQLPPALASKGHMNQEVTNWRENEQARNLFSALSALPSDAKLLVWCGNGHHTKEIVHAQVVVREGKLLSKPENEPDWIPMGYLFRQMSGLDPFTLHQVVRTVIRKTQEGFSDVSHQALDEYKVQLEAFGGIAGFLKEESPDMAQRSEDAFIFSASNTLE